MITGVSRGMVGDLVRLQWDLEKALAKAERLQTETMDRLDGKDTYLPGDGPIFSSMFTVVERTALSLERVRTLVDTLQVEVDSKDS